MNLREESFYYYLLDQKAEVTNHLETPKLPVYQRAPFKQMLSFDSSKTSLSIFLLNRM